MIEGFTRVSGNTLTTKYTMRCALVLDGSGIFCTASFGLKLNNIFSNSLEDRVVQMTGMGDHLSGHKQLADDSDLTGFRGYDFLFI
jgi:hypothetical protein